MSWTSRDAVNRMIKRKMERNKIAKEVSSSDDIDLKIFNTIKEIDNIITKFNIDNEQGNQLAWALRQDIYESCQDLKRKLCLYDMDCRIELDFSEAEFIYDMRIKGIKVYWSKSFSEKNNIDTTYIDVSWGFLNQF